MLVEKDLKNKDALLSMNNLDVHVHSPYSACCEDITFENLREKAARLGMTYAVTDHSTHLYFPRELAWSLHKDEFKTLFAEYRSYGRKNIEKYIEECRKNAPLLGIELDIYSDETLVFEEDLFDELDIVVGAVHFISGINKKNSVPEILDEYKRLTNAIVSSGKIDILGHPFRTLAYNKIPFTDDLIEWTVECCKKNNIAVELNSHYKFPDKDIKMVECAQALGVRIVYGSDAHHLKEFGDYSYQENICPRTVIA
jgi:histidinol phosphatase-like PHP family hydrolase